MGNIIRYHVNVYGDIWDAWGMEKSVCSYSRVDMILEVESKKSQIELV